MPELPPFYFPTCTVLVDDEFSFLSNFSLSLDSRLAFRLFDSARRALACVEAQRQEAAAVEGYFSPISNTTELNPDHVIQVNLPRLYQEIYNPRRFSEISVALVDYAMPEMNGLEFCRHIRRHHIKTILLTGKADEKVAVEAFNEGLIDRFIFKSEGDVGRRVNQAIDELQRVYFQEKCAPLARALTAHALPYLRDERFGELFTRLQEQYQWVEYYLLDCPRGFLLLDQHGRTMLLIVTLPEDLRTHYEIAQDEQAPAALLEVLAQGHHIPFFQTTDGYYQQGYESWRSDLRPAEIFRGTNTYVYAVIPNPPLAYLHLEGVRSYRDFLRQLDAESDLAAAQS